LVEVQDRRPEEDQRREDRVGEKEGDALGVVGL
jgi:hypothetical protein